MVERVLEKMEILDVILDEVQRARKESENIRSELRQHIKEENEEFKIIAQSIGYLKIQSALRKQQSGFIAAAISAIVAGVMSFMAIFFNRAG